MLQSYRAFLRTGLVPAALLFAAAPAWADLTIIVDFDNESTDYKDSDGAQVTTSKSGLSADDRKALLVKVEEEYKDIKNIGTITVKEGKVPAKLGKGEYAVVISGGKAPTGGEFGDAGVDGGPSFVYLDRIKTYKEPGTDAQVTEQSDINTVAGETAGHEAGHRIGKLGHNGQSAATSPNKAKMVKGSEITIDQRKADSRFFTDAEIKAIQENYDKNAAPQAQPGSGKDLHAFKGDALPVTPDWAIDDNSWGGKIWLQAPAGWSAGYVNDDGEFIFATTNQDPGAEGDENTSYMGLLFQGVRFQSWDMALRDTAGNVFDFETFGFGSPVLTNVNPRNGSTFLTAELKFVVSEELLRLFIDNSEGDPTTGGFIVEKPIPEPASWVLMIGGFGLAGAALRRRSTRILFA